MFWVKFKEFTLDINENLKWNKLNVDIQSDEFSSLFYTTCMILVTNLMNLEGSKIEIVFQMHQPSEKMSERQEQILRYVGGYVIFSLKKHYNGLKKSSVLSTRTPATAALDFFTSLDTRFEVLRCRSSQLFRIHKEMGGIKEPWWPCHH